MVSDFQDQIMQNIHSLWSWWWDASNKADEPTREIATILLVILAIFWCIRAFTKSWKQIAPLPPGPKGLPVVGYLPFLGTNLHHTFTKLAHKYGPIYKLWLGNKLCVVLNSPLLAKEVFRDQDINFANPDPTIAAYVFAYGGNDIAASPYGPYWRRMRKLFVRQVLSNANLEASYDLRKNEVRMTIRNVYSRVGTPVGIGELIFVTELNTIMTMLMGGRTDREEISRIGADFREAVTQMMEIVGKLNISDLFPVLARFDLQGVEQQSKDCLRKAERIIDNMIDQRMGMAKSTVEGDLKNKGRRDFLQILLDLMDHEDADMPLEKTQIKAVLLDTMIGGTDTTSTMAEWVMAEIMCNPASRKKVQEELVEVVGLNNIVEESHLPKLKYLGAVVKETFRLHPALPLLVPRRPNQSCVVGGYTIPKNTKVFINISAIHMDPQYWDNPSEFKPERFLSYTNQLDFSGNSFHYLPFGSGRRICPGIPLAERMLMYLLASLLHSFEWHLPEGEDSDLTDKFGIVVKKNTPLIAIPDKRLSKDLYT